MIFIGILLLLSYLFAPSTSASTAWSGGKTARGAHPAPTAASAAVWQPKPGTSWQWQITGTVDQSLPVQMYDVDLFDAQAGGGSYAVPGFGTVNVPRGANPGLVAQLHAAGRVVICYMDTGAWESYRPDAGLFPSAVIGNQTYSSTGSAWQGEHWLDIRQGSWSRFEPLILARMDLAKRAGCDGVEADQNNPTGNNPGFPITLADQKAWYLEVARQLHARGLSAGQKNGIETTDAATVAAFDWNLNEECNKYSECGVLNQFTAAGKAVFQVEYTEDGQTTGSFCPNDNAAGFDGLLKHLDLGSWVQPCRSYPPPVQGPPPPCAAPSGTCGYEILTGGGGIYSFGDARYFGNLIDHGYPGPASGLGMMPGGGGYQVLTAGGGIYSFGSAQGRYYGNLIDHGYPGPAAAIGMMPDGNGYQILTAGGGLYSFGSAQGHYYGNLIDHGYPGPAVGLAMMPDGNGYSILTAGGGVYSFGSAQGHYYGNLIDHGYPGPAVSLAATGTGLGYEILTASGALYTFGNAAYLGNLIDHSYPGPAVAIANEP